MYFASSPNRTVSLYSNPHKYVHSAGQSLYYNDMYVIKSLAKQKQNKNIYNLYVLNTY